MLLFFFLERLCHHAATQEGQYGKGYPVVHALYQVAERAGTHPPYQGHECLEESEKECHDQHGAQEGALQYDATGYGYGKTVHGKSEGQ